MMALRADVVWERILQGDPKRTSFYVVHFNSDDVPDAYCVYSTKYYDRTDSGPDQELSVQDFAYSDMNAYRGIWNFLLSHDLVGRVVWGNVPEDDPAPGLLLEPRCLNRKIGDGIWFRPIDVAGLLAARGYDVDGEVTIGVRDDDLCPWNNRSYRLTVNGGEASVETSERDGDITCTPNSLGSLISGYSSASYLSRIGRIEAADVNDLPRLDALFSTRYRPLLSFGF
jgi:predicted acetyltransferase